MALTTNTRRQFLAASTAATVGQVLGETPKEPVPGGVIDTHTHFYDPTRPQGVPWPRESEKALYRTVLPEHYKTAIRGQGVLGTVVVEASSWFEDNQWVLDLAKDESLITGFIGKVAPGSADFLTRVDTLAKNPLFRGIRLSAKRIKPDITRPLAALAERGLTLDILGAAKFLDPTFALAKKIPDLKIVLDHLAGPVVGGDKPDPVWAGQIRRGGEFPNIYLKLSNLTDAASRGGKDSVPLQPTPYRPWVDVAWDAFGKERILYGSNWPVSTRSARYIDCQNLAIACVREKDPGALEDVFRENSRRVYGWKDRR